MNKGIWNKITDFWKKMDASSKPALFMFVVVLTAAGGLNYVNLSPIVGNFLSAVIALFFGIGVLSWHIVEARTDDSKYQEDVAKIAKWLNVFLDGCLLVVNLFRSDLRALNVFDGMSAWDTAAFICIGVSAASHVIGYLLWTENDPHRLAKKEQERGISEVRVMGERANIAISRTEEYMKKLKWIAHEEQRLRAEYSSVPGININQLVTSMKNKALEEFKDINKSEVTTSQQGQANTRPAMAQTVKREELDERPNQ